ncbi:coniferyl alcohol acyltransferase [Macadamia integrifolia]|uniref:coniferyl alcohol acyltransferase n=1 Tax=Macadamia integrifolia TaxID=60698 RepID=UPI001C4E69B9|nr:coniferyl alcohol acyltransferase [Macadamia integrifolia]
MEVENPVTDDFDVKFTGKSIVKASGVSSQPYVISVSNLDLLSGRFPVTYFYVYPKPPFKSFPTIVKDLKSSLSGTLKHYYPFAGQIVTKPESGEPEIVCDNHGALLVEAYANISLEDLDFYNLNKSLQGKLVSTKCEVPLQVQVTNYACGGISITFTFDHALGDASTFGKFLASWSELAQGKSISCVPDHRRHLRPRLPSTYDPSLDDCFISCSLEEIINMPANDILLKRLYHIDASSIDHLQTLASMGGVKRTKIEAFSAYVWKIMVATIDESNTHCKMGWLVDGRKRMGPDPNSMSNYIGNVLSVAVGEASVVDLKQLPLSSVATMVHESIGKVTNEAHFLDLIDWIECHRPGLMLAKIVLGRGGPALVVSSGHRFPVAELDFGFGSPVLGTVCSTIKRIGVGYMNQRPSAKGDGSWVVSTILWPALVTALESDPHHIFQPMTKALLGF